MNIRWVIGILIAISGVIITLILADRAERSANERHEINVKKHKTEPRRDACRCKKSI